MMTLCHINEDSDIVPLIQQIIIPRIFPIIDNNMNINIFYSKGFGCLTNLEKEDKINQVISGLKVIFNCNIKIYNHDSITNCLKLVKYNVNNESQSFWDKIVDFQKKSFKKLLDKVQNGKNTTNRGIISFSDTIFENEKIIFYFNYNQMCKKAKELNISLL